MNKNDRPKLSKIHWHYLIIDEGHRIKNASCKLNADLKHFQSSHRLLLTGTPLQVNGHLLLMLLFAVSTVMAFISCDNCVIYVYIYTCVEMWSYV